MREPFAGPGPSSVGLGGHPHVQTPDDDPAYLYQNLLVALDRERGINIGEPRWHACWLAACNIKVAETVVQVGAGSGYYTAILAHLVGPDGRGLCLRNRRSVGGAGRQEPYRTASGRGAHAVGRRAGPAASRSDLRVRRSCAAEPNMA